VLKGLVGIVRGVVVLIAATGGHGGVSARRKGPLLREQIDIRHRRCLDQFQLFLQLTDVSIERQP
jgi:hypothetical protein